MITISTNTNRPAPAFQIRKLPMKIIACLLPLSARHHLRPRRGPPLFPTDKEAIDHLCKIVHGPEAGLPRSSTTSSGSTLPDNNAATNIKPVMDSVFAVSGALRSADVMRVLKYGPSVRHAGYTLVYEHSLIVFDAWFFEKPKGWQLVKYNVIVNIDLQKTLDAIPLEFGSPVEGY